MSSTIDFPRFTLRQVEDAAAQGRADIQGDVLRRAERLRCIALELLRDGEADAAYALVQRAEGFESLIDPRRRDAMFEREAPKAHSSKDSPKP